MFSIKFSLLLTSTVRGNLSLFDDKKDRFFVYNIGRTVTEPIYPLYYPLDKVE